MRAAGSAAKRAEAGPGPASPAANEHSVPPGWGPHRRPFQYAPRRGSRREVVPGRGKSRYRPSLGCR